MLVEALMEEHRRPAIIGYRVPSPRHEGFLSALRTAVRHRPQVLYLSAHGCHEGPGFTSARNIPWSEALTYERLGQVLTQEYEQLDHHSSTHLVLGICFGMRQPSRLVDLLPAQIYRVSGFVGEPFSSDTAGLLAAAMVDDVRLLKTLVEEHKARLEDAASGFDFGNFVAVAESVLASHNEDPAAEVVTWRGRAIVIASRTEDETGWATKHISLL